MADRKEPRPAAVVGPRGALICPCAAARWRPAPVPSARGFYGAGSAGAGAVPATVCGAAEGGGGGCRSELGFCGMSGKSGGSVGDVTGAGGGRGSYTSGLGMALVL
jgi:hypothetical protein